MKKFAMLIALAIVAVGCVLGIDADAQSGVDGGVVLAIAPLATQKAVFLNSLKEEYEQIDTWLSEAEDLSSFVVDGQTIKFPEAGADPAVYKNRTTDVDSVEPTETVYSEDLDVYDSQNYKIRNIERGGTGLEYRKKDDRRVLVVVEGEKKDGTKVKVEAGTTGGDRITMKVPGATDEASLKKVAEQVLEEKCYTGYSGSFSGWLWPYCDAGYKVSLHDPDYEYKDGTYYVTAVEVNYSQSGGKRTITLGKRLS